MEGDKDREHDGDRTRDRATDGLVFGMILLSGGMLPLLLLVVVAPASAAGRALHTAGGPLHAAGCDDSLGLFAGMPAVVGCDGAWRRHGGWSAGSGLVRLTTVAFAGGGGFSIGTGGGPVGIAGFAMAGPARQLDADLLDVVGGGKVLLLFATR